MTIHFSPENLALLNNSHRPGGLVGVSLIAQDKIETIQSQQCSCADASSAPAESQKSLARFAAQVRRDPLLMRKLGERVYELMAADLAAQRERDWHYGARE